MDGSESSWEAVHEERRGRRVFFGVGEAEGWIGSSYEYLQIQGPS